jgi:hypothetical protein
VVATVILRGQAITEWRYLNPDETGLLVEARAALHSPVPFSTWLTGTLGPYWPLFLAGLATLGAPLTPAFAHLLTAVLLALTAAALFVAASRTIGRGPALVATMVWWLPIATTFAVGVPEAYNSLSTEYLPVLLVVASALVPREQLAARPWLFAVLGVLAGLAVGAKFQVAPLAVAFAAAQLIVLRPSVRRIVVSVLWWLAGALLPVAAIVLVMVASPATNWVLVEQNSSFLGSYAAGPSPVQRFALTFEVLIPAGGYIIVALAGLIWLGRHSDKWSNVARVVLITGGLTAMLIGGMGFPPYLILLFGAGALAATMPVKPDASLLPQRLSPRVLAGALAIVRPSCSRPVTSPTVGDQRHPGWLWPRSPPIRSTATPQWPARARPGREPWSGAGRPNSTSNRTGRALCPTRTCTGLPSALLSRRRLSRWCVPGSSGPTASSTRPT